MCVGRERGGAAVGPGVGPRHVGGRWQGWTPSLSPLLWPPPLGSPAPGFHHPSPAPLNRRTTRPPLPASRLAHDHPVPFSRARLPQVPPVRGLTLTVDKAGSSASVTPGVLAQPCAPLPSSWDCRSPQSAGITLPRDTWRHNLGLPFPPRLPREGIHFPLCLGSHSQSESQSETGNKPSPK